ncbi:Site-specific recombinase, phage integrase family [Neorhizobium galegae bv. officinalis bv. officinalis str. HAMBI 1141]|uniref:Site-specific recombinase, phage integrase family n=1 Tax=Neorhizobium galegae bv. officinalis bv. officinalis str. HAMBI 1141 TaxID=1028801 RepID=A0A068T3F0_NEOGA|nr:tyrosine-type recombinase/integrase [Neorhizobium galegae]CDN52556.1 Site-specific recombinase, phage integrase family [Neorhizobium galegae bv. officinalis bv. officinalis str. HAMBI 1141]
MDMPIRTAVAPPPAHPGTLVRTFAEAAASYIEHGGQAQYLGRIVDRIGDRAMTEIFPFDVKHLANQLYPAHQNSTRNRCVITPVRAVVYHAYDRGWGPAIRLRNLKEDPPKRKKAASQPWLHAFVRQCAKDELPHLAALVLFMSQTGARVSEAVALQWGEVDLLNRTALLLKTKTGANSTRFLTDQLISRLYDLKKGSAPSDPVFRYHNRHAVNERIEAVCRRADIPYKPSHTCGRHAFANIALSMGLDIKTTMDAGGWKSIAVFLGTYANPRNAGRAVAERFNVYQYDADL